MAVLVDMHIHINITHKNNSVGTDSRFYNVR